MLLVCSVLMCAQSLLMTCVASVPDECLDKVSRVANEIPLDDGTVSLEKEACISSGTKSADLLIQDDYTLEIHSVTTEDGYVLTLHRMAGAPGSIPVLLQHGLLESSACWLISKKSLAFYLSERGYDVWMANARGSTHSRKHRTLSTTDPQFWNFTWHELGVYDLPAMITYITQLKNDSLFYVGHSMGGTDISVMAIERPEIAKSVKAAICLAPATYVYHIRSPLKFIAPFWNAFQRIANAFGIYEFMPRNSFFDFYNNYICESSLFRNAVCGNILFLIGGFDSDQLDYNLLPKIWSMMPSGTSIKLYTHWMQQMVKNEFQKFDYGPEGNLKMYNSTVPPDYELSKAQIPIAVFYSKNDWLVGVEDALYFYEQIPLKLGIYKIENDRFNHFDFLWGKDVENLLNAKVLDVMVDYENS